MASGEKDPKPGAPGEPVRSGPDWAVAVDEWSKNVHMGERQVESLPGAFAHPLEESPEELDASPLAPREGSGPAVVQAAASGAAADTGPTLAPMPAAPKPERAAPDPDADVAPLPPPPPSSSSPPSASGSSAPAGPLDDAVELEVDAHDVSTVLSRAGGGEERWSLPPRSAPTVTLDEDFYDAINIEKAGPQPAPDPEASSPSREFPRPPEGQQTPRVRWDGWRPGRRRAEDRSDRGGAEESFEEFSLDSELKPARALDDGDRTPIPDEPEPAPPVVPRTILMEADLPPEPRGASSHSAAGGPAPTSQRSPAEVAPLRAPSFAPQPSSVFSVRPSGATPHSPPQAVTAMLLRATPQPTPPTGRPVPRRLPLPTAAAVPAAPPLAAGSAGGPGVAEAVRREWMGLLDAETRDEPQGQRALGLAVQAARQAEVLGETADAIDRYRAVLDQDGANRAALRGLRRLLCQPGPASQPDEAATLLDRELEGATDKAERTALALLRGELALHVGNAEGARATFQEVLLRAESSSAGCYAALAGLADAAVLTGAESTGDLVVAVDALSDALAQEGDSPLRHALLLERARLDEMSGRTAAALGRYEALRAAALAGHGVAVGFGLLRLGLRGDERREARALGLSTLLREVTAAPLRAALLHHIGDEKAADDGAAAGDPIIAEEQARRTADPLVGAAALLAVPASGTRRAWLCLDAADRLERAQRWPEARGVLEQALKTLAAEGLGADPIAQRALRRALEAGGSAEERAALLQQAAQDPPLQPGQPGQTALALLTLARHLAAPPLLERARAAEVLVALLKEHPRFAPAVVLLRDLLVAQGRLEEAAQLLLKSAGREDIHLREDAAGLLWRHGQPVTAARVLLAADDEAPEPRLRTALRWQAQRLLWGRVALSPEADPELAGLLGDLLRAEAEGCKDRARAADLWYRRALLLHNLYPLVQVGGGPVEDSLRLALQADPAHVEALLLLSERTLTAEDGGALWSQLVAQLRERLLAATGRPEVAVLLLRLSLLAREGGDVASAMSTLGLLRVVAPAVYPMSERDPELLYLALRSGDLNQLIELRERELDATEDLERRFALLMLIGEHCLVQGNHQAAAERFAAALELRPGHPVAREARARALVSLGQFAELERLAREEIDSGNDISVKISGYERLASLEALAPAQFPGLALHAFQEILTLEAGHHLAMRALERYYIVRRDYGELIHLYAQLGLVATEPSFAVQVHLDRARLRQRLAWQLEEQGAAPEEILNELENDFRLALYRDPHSRPALRHMLATAMRTHDFQQVADLSLRLADICDQSGTGRGEAGDGRAAAVFLTRAAEAYRALGRSPEYVAQAYRAALSRNPRHIPALRGLLLLALEQQAYQDVADTAELLAAAMHDPRERYETLLLAAGAALEHLADEERTGLLLREAIRVEPRRSEAFERLRLLLSNPASSLADPAALATLLSDRLPHEVDPVRQMALRLELAQLLQGPLGNRARAKLELRTALSYEPGNEAVLAALAELHYQDHDWTEAADLLLRRARVERRPEELAEIFLRLGEIYGEHLPDARRAALSFGRVLELLPNNVAALQRLSAMHLQQGRPEEAAPLLARLAELTPDGHPKGREQRVTYLHKAARIYESIGDRRTALDMLRQAVAVDPMYLTAVGELAHFFDRQSDVKSMRVHLDRSAARFQQVLTEHPLDASAYRSLLQILLWRRAVDQATMAAEILAILEGEAALPAEATALLAVQTKKDGYPGETLRDSAFDDALFPASVPQGLRDLFRVLHEPLEKIYRVDARRLGQLGVDRRERLPRSGHPLRDLANRVASDMGVGDFDIYLTAAQGRDASGQAAPLCTLEATEPASLILSQSLVNGASEEELRFYLGRLLKLLQHHLVLPLRLSPEDLGLLVGGLVRQFVPDYVPIGFAEKRIANEAIQLQKIIPRRTAPQVLPLALECASSSLDLTQLEAVLLRCGNAAGLLTAGRLRPAYTALLRLGPSATPQVYDLFRFAVSQEFGELRRLLGTHLG